MGKQVTLQISDRIVRQATQLARKNRRSMEDVLAEWLESVAEDRPVVSLSDEGVQELTELTLSKKQESALSNLLVRNREGELDASGRKQLDELMQVYERGLLRKAQALRVAVQRGLREPLKP